MSGLFRFIGRNDIGFEAQVVHFLSRIVVQRDLPVLQVVFAIGIERYGDRRIFARRDRRWQSHFCTGAGNFETRNDQRFCPVIGHDVRVLEPLAFGHFGEFVQLVVNEKFRLAEAKSGIDREYDKRDKSHTTLICRSARVVHRACTFCRRSDVSFDAKHFRRLVYGV